MIQEEIEIWKPVVGYEGIYEVSSIGRVKRLAGSQNALKDRILRNNNVGLNYQLVKLCVKTIKNTQCVHRLVAHAFIPNPLNKPYINHIDRNPANNKVVNLEWCTQSENIIHSFKLGRIALKGEQRSKKLTSADILEIRRRRNTGEYGFEIAKSFGLSTSHVFRIAARKVWGHVL